MNKIIIMILIVISIIIIAVSFSVADGIYEFFLNSRETTQNIDINKSEKNTAIDNAIDFFGNVYFMLLARFIIICSVVAVACIWGIYGVILLVIAIIKKYKLQKNK